MTDNKTKEHRDETTIFRETMLSRAERQRRHSLQLKLVLVAIALFIVMLILLTYL